MVKSAKTILLSILAVVITAGLLFSGCSNTAATTTTAAVHPSTTVPGVSLSPAEQLKYEQALDTAATGLANLDTYQYEMTLNMDMQISGGDQQGALLIKTTSTGGVNKTAGETQLGMAVSMEGDALGDAGPQTVSYDVYLLKDWAYMRLEAAGIGEQWMKTPTSGLDESFSLNMAEKQTAVLDNPTTVKYLRTEKLNGVDCYVLSIEPTMEEMAKWYNEQGSNQLADDVNYGDIIKSFSIICYITANTNLLAKMTMNMTMSFTAEQADLASDSFDKMDADVLMELIIHDHNKPFSIVLPEDAAKAVEVPGETFSNMQ
jgi:hypothetical protein